ncbi:MAG: flagellar basal-body rod protein FlgG [Deltaproteobacteria bacterium]|nr:MAG: flagellar basal-body rod protein FlgG [Deltaproteobacteria bacterium]
MLKSLNTAATGMDAQQKKMDTIANNLANVNTTGFKKSRTEFEEVYVETLRRADAPELGGRPAPLETGLGVRTVATTRSFAQGNLVGTENPLDLAIEGDGFFQVRQPDGTVAYTRAGNFRLDATGRLVTQHGEAIEPEIVVPTDATGITVQRDGLVLATVPGRTEPIEVGTLELVLFPNPGGLEGMGRNLFRETPGSGAPLRTLPGEEGAGGIAQGFLETSNVTAVEEMIEMITTQRAYEMNSKVIQTVDQMLQRLANLR